MLAMSALIEMLGRTFVLPPPKPGVVVQTSTVEQPPDQSADGVAPYPLVSIESDVEFDENSDEVLFVRLAVTESPGRTQVVTMSPSTAEAVASALTKFLSDKK